MMKAVVFHGSEDVRVDEVGDPKIEQPTDAIVRLTSTAIGGSDLHLYHVLGPFIDKGDVLGHEPMGLWKKPGQKRRLTCGRGPGGDPVQHLLRALLDVRPAAVRAV